MRIDRNEDWDGAQAITCRLKDYLNLSGPGTPLLRPKGILPNIKQHAIVRPVEPLLNARRVAHPINPFRADRHRQTQKTRMIRTELERELLLNSLDLPRR